MPRPYVGPLIDFRVPGEAKQAAEEMAEVQGRFVDEVCRDIFLAGLEVLVGRRTEREPIAIHVEGIEYPVSANDSLFFPRAGGR